MSTSRSTASLLPKARRLPFPDREGASLGRGGHGILPALIAGLFLVAYLWLGIIGNGTRLYFQWPALGVFGLCLLLGVFAGRPHHFGWSRRAVVSVIVLAAYVLVRASISPIPYSARKDVCLLLGCAAVYLLFVFVLHAPSARQAVVLLFGLLGVANTAVALYQRLVNPHFHVFHAPGDSGPIPGSGLYFNYDHMAGFTELAALLCLAMAILGRGGRTMRLAFGGLGALSCVGVLVSMSRGGFLSLGAGLVALVAITWTASIRFQWPPATRRAIPVLGTFALIGFMGAGLVLLGKRFEASAESGTDKGIFHVGLGTRQENWSLAARQWNLAPLVGTGSGTYDEYSIRLWRGDWHRPDQLRHPIHAHNDYVQMLAEYGVVGLGLVLLVLAIHASGGIAALKGWMRSGGQSRPEFGNTRMALVAGSLCCLVAYGIHSVVDFNMRLLASATVIAFCLAVLASAGRRRKDPDAPESLGRAGSILGGILGLGLLVGTLRATPPEYHFEKLRGALNAEALDEALSHGSTAEKDEKRNHLLYRMLGYARMRYAEQFDLLAIRDGFLRSAVDAFQSGVALNPGDSHANVLLGRCLMELGDLDGAEKAFRNGLDWDPYGGDANGAFGELLLERAVDLLRRGDVERSFPVLDLAEEHLQRSLYSSSPIDPQRLDLWTQCQDALHEAHSAQGQRLDQEAEAAKSAGDAQAVREKHGEAMAAYRKSLDYKPTGSPDAIEELRRYNHLMEALSRQRD